MANIMNNSAQTEKEKRPRVPLAVWLVFLLVVTLAVGASIARYSSSASGDATARVAKFKVVVEEDGVVDNPFQRHTLSLRSEYTDMPDISTGTYGFRVRNKESEVTVQCNVIVRGVPAGVEVQLGDGAKQRSTGITDEMTFSGPVVAAGGYAYCKLKFYAPDEPMVATEKVAIGVEVVQVD